MNKKSAAIVMAAVMAACFCGCGGTSGGAQADENGNYVVNGSFEETDFTGWTVTNIDDVTEELNVYDRSSDALDGVQSLHFYSGSNDVNFTAEQTISGLEEGTYKMTASIQGDAAGDENASIVFYAVADGQEYTIDGTLNGYVDWDTVEISGISTTGEITIGVRVSTAPGGWGTIDAFTLTKE